MLCFSCSKIGIAQNNNIPQLYIKNFIGLTSLARCRTVVTLMTVGYGDMYPITTMGRVFAEVLMVIGVGLTAAFIGIVGSSVYKQVQELEKEE